MINLVQITNVELFMDNATIWSANNDVLYLAKIEKPMISIGIKSDETEYDKEYVQKKRLPIKQICRTGGVIVHVPGDVCFAMVCENTKENYLFFQKLNNRIAFGLSCDLIGNDFIQDKKYKIGSNMVCANEKDNLVWMCQINMNPMSKNDIEMIKKICLKERKYEPATWSGSNERILVQNLFDIIVTMK